MLWVQFDVIRLAVQPKVQWFLAASRQAPVRRFRKLTFFAIIVGIVGEILLVADSRSPLLNKLGGVN